MKAWNPSLRKLIALGWSADGHPQGERAGGPGASHESELEEQSWSFCLQDGLGIDLARG